MEQATRMWKLRVKIDVWSRGVDESLRQRNRELLVGAYLRLPPRRVLLYLKQFRVAALEQVARLEGENPFNHAELYFQGPEDTIARGKRLLSTAYARCANFEVACHIIKSKKLAQLMYKAAMNDVKMKQRPGLNIWADFTFDWMGFEQIRTRKLLELCEPRTFASAIHKSLSNYLSRLYS